MPTLSLDDDGRLRLQNKCDPEQHDINAVASAATGTVECFSNFCGVKLKIAISNLATTIMRRPNGYK
jgi:hypothetical protein